MKQSAPPAFANRVSFHPNEANIVVGVSRAQIYKWAGEGRFKIYKLGNVSLVLVEEYIAFVRTLGDHLGDQTG